MRIEIVKPSGFLAQYIKYYWVLESDLNDGAVSERVIPTGNVELMFHYRKPFLMSKNGTERLQPQSIITGVSSNYADVVTQGESGVIAVTFFPHGACNFFKFPLSELENQSISLSDLFANEVAAVEELLQSTTSLAGRIGVVERFLLKRFNPIGTSALQFIKQGVDLINQSGGQITASKLSDKLYVSPKSLERKFTSLLGKSPKQFIRIVRFNEVVRSISAPSNAFLTQQAYKNGYFDQSHFIHDFKALSGYTPKEFIAKCVCDSPFTQE